MPDQRPWFTAVSHAPWGATEYENNWPSWSTRPRTAGPKGESLWCCEPVPQCALGVLEYH